MLAHPLKAPIARAMEFLRVEERDTAGCRGGLIASLFLWGHEQLQLSSFPIHSRDIPMDRHRRLSLIGKIPGARIPP